MSYKDHMSYEEELIEKGFTFLFTDNRTNWERGGELASPHPPQVRYLPVADPNGEHNIALIDEKRWDGYQRVPATLIDIFASLEEAKTYAHTHILRTPGGVNQEYFTQEVFMSYEEELIEKGFTFLFTDNRTNWERGGEPGWLYPPQVRYLPIAARNGQQYCALIDETGWSGNQTTPDTLIDIFGSLEEAKTYAHEHIL